MTASPSTASALDSAIQQLQACGFPSFFGNLRDRWQDEREYEDFADYKAAVRARLPKGFALIKMTRRPFRCDFRSDSFPGDTFFVTATASRLSWGHFEPQA